jgi:trans-aconitate methyltransferase
MKTAPSPDFYDALLDDPTSAFLGSVEDSPYRELYQRVVALVRPGTVVVELGCGSGRLAMLLVDVAWAYIGLDFSKAMIEQARRDASRKFDLMGHFVVADLRTNYIPDADIYIATEVLEHLDDDLALLARLPSESTVILTVPSFDSESHVRTFPNPGDAVARYEGLLDIDTEERIDLPAAGAFFHLIRGTVR